MAGKQNTTEANDDEPTYEPADVIGHAVFNPDRGMGLDVVVDRKTVSNLRGDTKDVFVCDKGAGATDHPEVSRRFVNRDVEQVMRNLNEYGYELYEPGELWDDVDASDFDLEGDD